MDSPTSTAYGYAFLNHSSATVPHNLPPNVDDKPLARQRRRRTSPEDQATLEAAYLVNPKPDKPARLELVKRVALGEKEVQIWFQNRRQSSRRRSRPLLPHEIAQYQLSRSAYGYQPSSPELPFSSSLDESPLHPAKDSDGSISEVERPPIHHLCQTKAERSGLEPSRPATLEDPQSSSDHSSPATCSSRMLETRVPPPPKIAATTGSDTPLSSVTFPRSRRSVPGLHTARPVEDTKSSSQVVENAYPERGLRKSSTFVRLSMTGEGNATVETKNTFSPSPPRPTQASQPVTAAMQGLVPSTESLNRNPSFSGTVKPLQRSSSGRSRDFRAWEFWCDKDARAELEDKAEKDANGSAADAIGLLRSGSGRSILGAIPSKRNSMLSRQSSSFKRPKLVSPAPKLQKSSTSLGILQNRPAGEETTFTAPTASFKHSMSAIAVYAPGNDSDKENWSPDAEGALEGHSGLDRLSSGSALVRSSKSGSQRQTERTSVSGAKIETSDPEADEELAAFMQGAPKSNRISREDDLDCVQGLLSLSQGNWR
ncbi:Homeobox protein yox1 [Vermiconidia calcicola]|uniref:Homeobox protein yox1 n=1 Tax=Vermiconidia calcicola TaxID=1690605 RepID=A0ACC3NSM3_9PEZI|nr:Homeobox protein yox1 [Vermiconidia calcicola]